MSTWDHLRSDDAELLVGDARSLDLESFRQRHGEVFLLQTEESASLRAPPRPQKTVTIRKEDLLKQREDLALGRGLDFLVFPVRKGSSPFPFISVGRTRNNDIVILDESVSKFHALIKRKGEGQYTIQDAGSMNGTTVNGAVAPNAKEDTPPLDLSSGARVRFGSVEFYFIDADDFCARMKRRWRRP